MKVFELNRVDSLAAYYLSQLRDQVVQKDRLRFRANVQRLGQIMAFEISKHLPYITTKIQTPIQTAQGKSLNDWPVLITVLRAGLPYHQGFLDYFDQSDSGFIGAYRKEGEEKITVNVEYLSAPSVQGRPVILIDPMLATGNSFLHSLNALEKHGMPSHVFLVSLIAAPEGIENLKKNAKNNCSLWTVAVDDGLNDNFYIVPGLGDAGDLSFGYKL
ncbi:MAG: uracil phosphoribosyltransferase [Flammeovirgaceae bacterium]